MRYNRVIYQANVSIVSVLVGITTRNRCEILPKAITSALAQHYSPLQVSVFDDNSSDKTYLVKDQFPNVQWDSVGENKGLVYARNKLMMESTARYFCSLDDDAWFLGTDVIATAIRYFESSNDVAAIAFDILSPDLPTEKQRSEYLETGIFIGCGHILRLSAVRDVGFYDVFPCSYGSEEKDLCIKLMDKGYRIIYLPGVHIWHDKTSLERDEKAQYLSVVCNDMVFLYRRAPIILLPGLFIQFFKHLKFSFSYKKGLLFASCMKGFSRFLSQLLSFKLKRRPVSIKTFYKFHKLNRS